MTETEKKARAVRAEQLLADPLLIEAAQALENEAVKALAEADVSDHAALMRATADLQAARRFVGHLNSLVREGKFAGRTPPAAA